MAQIISFMNSKAMGERKLDELNKEYEEADARARSMVMQQNLRSDNGHENSEEDLMDFFESINELAEIRNAITDQEVKLGKVKPEDAKYHVC